MPVEKHLGYSQLPQYNPAAFQKFSLFIQFDLLFARDKNTDIMLVDNRDLGDISERVQEDETVPINNPHDDTTEKEIPEIDINIDINFNNLTSEE